MRLFLPLLVLAACRVKDDSAAPGESRPGVDTAPIDEDGDGSPSAEDCDDSNAAVSPALPETPYDGLDNDCDPTSPDDDLDGDGYTAEQDCDDAEDDRYPDAPELCNSADDDCDGEVDEHAGGVWYTDADGDGYGDASLPQQDCDGDAGLSAVAGDCDDADPTLNPTADELCDGVDNDCDASTDEPTAVDADLWYQDADGDGFGVSAYTTRACTQPEGYAAQDGDCDDAAAGTNPGAAERCGGGDEDCDGAEDIGAIDAPTWNIDYDGDGYGATSFTTTACDPGAGWVADDTDCDDRDAAIFPGAAEVCNGEDDDCDGLTDDDDPDGPASIAIYVDGDGDGYGAGAGIGACALLSGYSMTDDDCDDGDASVSPGAAEVYYDGLDSDCDGASDYDADGDGVDSYSEAGGADCLDSDASVTACGESQAAAGQSCYTLQLSDSTLGDGLYWIDPDDDGDTTDAREAWCDMSTDGGGWTKVESAHYPFWFTTSNWSSYGSAGDTNYSYVVDLDDFARSGVWTFLFEVGNSGTWTTTTRAHYTVWSQEHNPFTDTTNGSDYTYIAGEQSTTCSGFNGLHDRYYTTHGIYCMSSDVDSTESANCWWMQVIPLTQYGSSSSYPGYLEGYGGPNVHTWQVLWVR